jgi:hypothetical protein
MFQSNSRSHYSRRSIGRAIVFFLFSGVLSIVIAYTDQARAGIQPELVQPVHGFVSDNGCEDRSNDIVWGFFWNEVPGATQYQLYVIGENAENPAINRSDITSISYQEKSAGSYIGDSNRFRWRWYVRAVVNGAWTDWSEPGLFNVESVNTDCR